jgi:hypothetical protein
MDTRDPHSDQSDVSMSLSCPETNFLMLSVQLNSAFGLRAQDWRFNYFCNWINVNPAQYRNWYPSAVVYSMAVGDALGVLYSLFAHTHSNVKQAFKELRRS